MNAPPVADSCSTRHQIRGGNTSAAFSVCARSHKEEISLFYCTSAKIVCASHSLNCFSKEPFDPNLDSMCHKDQSKEDNRHEEAAMC